MNWTKRTSFHIHAVAKSRLFTAKRLCIHKIPSLLLTHTTETYTPIFRIHQHPPMYCIITRYPWYTKILWTGLFVFSFNSVDR